jgi:iron-regulated transporter 1
MLVRMIPSTCHYAISFTPVSQKYVLTMILADPHQFRWAGLVSWIAVVLGAVFFMIYVRRMRGHLLHFDWASQLVVHIRLKSN